MKQFTLFNTKSENFKFIIDIFKMLVGNNVEIEYYKDCLLIVHNEYDNNEIKQTFHSLEMDLDTNICIYTSYPCVDNFKKELELIYPNFINKEFGSYNLKELLLSCDSIVNSLGILHFIVDGTGVDEVVIEKMAEANLNVSKAASLLYLHRNSLNYKIEKLIDSKNFDLKNFKDCHILYRLKLKA